MVLLTGSFSELPRLKSAYPDAIFIAVTRARPPVEGIYWMPSLGPSSGLLREFLEAKRALVGRGLEPFQAHRRAWEKVNYDERYVRQILTDRAAMERVRRIRRWLVEGKTVVLLCHEPESWRPYCHRFLLKDIILGRPRVLPKRRVKQSSLKEFYADECP